MSDADHTRINETIINLQREMIGRLYRGESNYEGNKRLLERHMAIARKLENAYLIMRLHEASGILKAWFGRFDEAYAAFEDAISVCKTMEDRARLPVLLANLGETYRIAGENAKAVEAFHEAIKIAEDAQNKAALVLANTNLGLSLLALEKIEAAKYHFEYVINLTADDTWNHIQQLIEIRRGLAEVHLIRGEHELAWRYANDAIYLAKGRDHTLPMIEVYITMGHIAEDYADAPEPAAYYYTLGRDILKEQGKSVPIARILLQEALYQYFRENLDAARRLAKEAHLMFIELNVEGDSRLAKYIISMDQA